LHLAAAVQLWYPSAQSKPEEPPMEPCKTLTVPEAGRVYFDLGRNASYEAARRGDIPTIRIGRLLRVPVIALERILEQTGK
jgi:Helix-turn-helix domain